MIYSKVINVKIDEEMFNRLMQKAEELVVEPFTDVPNVSRVVRIAIQEYLSK
jgi:hypothetical protein